MPAAALRYRDNFKYEHAMEFIELAATPQGPNDTECVELRNFLITTYEMEVVSSRFAAWQKYRAAVWEFTE